MGDTIPRRMQRFNRNAQNGTMDQENYAPQVQYANPQAAAPQEKPDPFLSPSGRQILRQLPSTEYEDVHIDKDNLEELKRIKQRTLEEAIALSEVEKFKETHKRLPSGKESDTLAENIFTQLKNVDTNAMYGGAAASAQGSPRDSPRNRRLARRHGQDAQEDVLEPVTQAPLPQQGQSSSVLDVKALLEDDATGTEKKGKKGGDDEFDLGIDDALSGGDDTATAGDADDIESLETDSETCPNCKKSTEKVRYCPKCGTAFCEQCAKKNPVGLFICPKCGTTTKA